MHPVQFNEIHDNVAEVSVFQSVIERKPSKCYSYLMRSVNWLDTIHIHALSVCSIVLCGCIYSLICFHYLCIVIYLWHSETLFPRVTVKSHVPSSHEIFSTRKISYTIYLSTVAKLLNSPKFVRSLPRYSPSFVALALLKIGPDGRTLQNWNTTAPHFFQDEYFQWKVIF